jgi:hypothetical protein
MAVDTEIDPDYEEEFPSAKQRKIAHRKSLDMKVEAQQTTRKTLYETQGNSMLGKFKSVSAVDDELAGGFEYTSHAKAVYLETPRVVHNVPVDAH